jgi:xylitol oxidase
MSPDAVRARYTKLPEFIELLRRHDPNGMFRNGFMDRYIFGAA